VSRDRSRIIFVVFLIFKSEDLAFDPMGSLSTELGEMIVYSLLDESKQIAAKMKLKKVSKQSP